MKILYHLISPANGKAQEIPAGLRGFMAAAKNLGTRGDLLVTVEAALKIDRSLKKTLSAKGLSICDYSGAISKRLAGWQPDLLIGLWPIPDELPRLFPGAVILEEHPVTASSPITDKAVIFTARRAAADFKPALVDCALKEQLSRCRTDFLAPLTWTEGRTDDWILLDTSGGGSDTEKISEVICRRYPTIQLPRGEATGLSLEAVGLKKPDYAPLSHKWRRKLAAAAKAVVTFNLETAVWALLADKPVFMLPDWRRPYQSEMSREEALDNFLGRLNEPHCGLAPGPNEAFLYYILTHEVSADFLAFPDNTAWFFETILSRHKAAETTGRLVPVTSTVSQASLKFKNMLERPGAPDIAVIGDAPSSKGHGQLRNGLRQTVSLVDEADPLAASYEKLRGMILGFRFKAVVFNVFETLLVRPATVRPRDVLAIISPAANKILGMTPGLFNFKASRRQAEKYARESLADARSACLTLDDIYRQFQSMTGLSTEKVEAVKTLEIEAELRFLRPRASALGFLELALDAGRTVFLTAETCLPQKVVRQALALGDTEGNPLLYIYDRSNKAETWQRIQTDCHAGEMLYIGHDRSGLPEGTEFFHFSAVAESMKRDQGFFSQMTALTREQKYGNFHIGLIAHKLYDDPCRSLPPHSLCDGSPFLLGYNILGPCLTSLAMWLVKEFKRKNIDKILFLSRDGYLVKKIYDRVNEILYGNSSAQSVYYYISRFISCRVFAKKHLLASFVDSYLPRRSITLREGLLRFYSQDILSEKYDEALRRYGLKPEEPFGPQRDAGLRFLIDTPDFYSRGHEEKIDLAGSYFQQAIGDTDLKKIACFDGHGRGSAKQFLSMLAGVDLPCFVLSRNFFVNSIPETLEAYIENFPILSAEKREYREVVFFEELVSCHHEGTVLDYRRSEDGLVEPILSEPGRATEADFIEEVHRGCLDFLDDYLSLLGPQAEIINDDPHNVFTLPIEMVICGRLDRDLIKRLHLRDEFMADRDLLTVSDEMALSEPGGQPASAGRRDFFYYWLFGSAGKYNKFKKDPSVFFADSRRPYIRLLGRAYDYLSRKQ